MLTRRLMALVPVLALTGLAACNGDTDDPDFVAEDTIMRTGVEEVEVPVQTTDTLLERTEMSIDTAVDVDTIENPRRDTVRR